MQRENVYPIYLTKPQFSSRRIWNGAVPISESLSTDTDAYLGYVLYTNN